MRSRPIGEWGRWVVRGCLGGVVLALLAFSSPVHAGSTETRVFKVTIDNKQAGDYAMTITQHDDGTVSMHGEAAVSVKMYYIKNYQYKYKGTEVWRGTQLTKLESEANDDGKQYKVVAWPVENGLRVWTNGKTRTAQGERWTTTYWRQPDQSYWNQSLTLLDADTGKDIQSVLEHLGDEQRSVAGKWASCKAFRLRDGVRVELWYDAQKRLVREESVEDGIKMVLELSSVSSR
jgi:hypothetical protein